MSAAVLIREALLPRAAVWLVLTAASVGVSFPQRTRGIGRALYRSAIGLAVAQGILVLYSVWLDATKGTLGPFSASFGLFFVELPVAAAQAAIVLVGVVAIVVRVARRRRPSAEQAHPADGTSGVR